MVAKRVAAMSAELDELLAEPLEMLSTAEQLALAAQWETLTRRQAAMGHGNAGQQGGRERTRYAGDHFARNASRRERQRLFPAAPEHERVAALQADDAVAAMVGMPYFSETLLAALAAPEPNGENRKLTLSSVIRRS